MRSTFRKHTESKADSDSRFRVLVLDSLSHGYCLDSQNRLFAQKEKGCYPLSPHSQSPEKVSTFCAATKYIFWRECLAFSASSAIVAEALLPPCSNDCTPRSGRVSVGATALHILLDFCCAKMAESIGIDSA